MDQMMGGANIWLQDNYQGIIMNIEEHTGSALNTAHTWRIIALNILKCPTFP